MTEYAHEKDGKLKKSKKREKAEEQDKKSERLSGKE